MIKSFITQRVEKGKHNFKPDYLKIWRGDISLQFTVIFDENAIYDLGDNDQWDWNKGGGISNNLFSNFKESVMWTWRWNLETKEFEFSGYFHNKNDVYYAGRYFDKDMIVSMLPGKVLVAEVAKKKNLMQVRFKDEEGVILQTFIVQKSKDNCLSRIINAWFGGNKVAPKDLSFRSSYIKL